MSADEDSFEVTSFDNYLINEKICASEISDDTIFEELSRLSESTEKSVDELLKEAETLISYPQLLPLQLNFQDVDEYFKSTNNISCESTPCEMKPLGLIDRMDTSQSGKLLDDVFEVIFLFFIDCLLGIFMRYHEVIVKRLNIHWER